MPKLKTHKATAKRIKITAKKKYLQRQATQDHFNAREKGRKTMSKRRDKQVDSTNAKYFKRTLPYN